MKKFLSRLFLTSFVAFLVACSGGSNPESVAKKFVEKSYRGDADAVVSMIYVSDADKEKPGIQELVDGKIKAAVAEKEAFAEKKGGVAEVTTQPFEAFDQDPNKGVVMVETRFKNNDEISNSRVRVIKTDDGWKVIM